MQQRISLIFVLACLLTQFPQRSSGQRGLDQLLEQSEAPGASDSGVTQQQDSVGKESRTEKRITVPTGTAAIQAVAKVRDIFRSEYGAATTPQTKAVFARQLLSQASQTPSPVERWALYTEAIRFATDAGDAAGCFEMISTAAAEFLVNEDGLKLDALSTLSKTAPPQAMDDLARSALELANKCAAAGDTKDMRQALGIATSIAKKTRNEYLAAEITKLQRFARERTRQIKLATRFEDRLKADPDDAATCLEAGKFFCFELGDWETGLRLLTRGSDDVLRDLARVECSRPVTPVEICRLADAWWDWAQEERGQVNSAASAHAAKLYSSVIQEFHGLERARIEKRINSVEQIPGNRGQGTPLAELAPVANHQIKFGLQKPGVFQGHPLVCGGKHWTKGFAAVPGADEPTQILYLLPEGSQSVSGRVGVFHPFGQPVTNGPHAPLFFEVHVNGRVAWKSRGLLKINDMDEFNVPLFGSQRLELRTKCESDLSTWAAWLEVEFY